MKRWIGRALIVIGVLHTVVGGFIFGEFLPPIAREGFLGTIGEGHPDVRNAAFWFFAAGFLIVIFGGLLDHVEATRGSLPAFLPWAFAAFAVVGALMMPKSGFWMLLVPVAGMLLRRRSLASASGVST